MKVILILIVGGIGEVIFFDILVNYSNLFCYKEIGVLS